MLGDLVRYDTGECVAVLTKQKFARSATSRAGSSVCRRRRRISGRTWITKWRSSRRKPASSCIPTRRSRARRRGKRAADSDGRSRHGQDHHRQVHHARVQESRSARRAVRPHGQSGEKAVRRDGEEAKTIHRLLDLDWKDGGEDSHTTTTGSSPLDVVIVDEVSMVDEYVFNALLSAMERGSRLVLVGDKDQLASVGAGNVLSDLIKCGRFPVSELTQIYRQSEDSRIVVNAHRINRGEMPELDNRSSDFSSRKRRTRSPSRARRRIWSHAGLPGYLKVPPMEIQVLCPMKRGSAGTASLNRILQEKLNPPSRDKKGSAAGGHTLPRGRQSDADAEQLPAGMGADERRQGGDWHGSVQRRHRSIVEHQSADYAVYRAF